VSRRTNRSTVIVLLLGAAILAGCGSSAGRSKSPSTSPPASDSPPITSVSQWDRPAAEKVQAVAAEVARAFKGQCTDNAFLPRDQYAANIAFLRLEVPLAVSDCTAFGGDVEFSAFPTAAERDAWIAKRTDALCKRAKTGQVAIGGLHFVLVGSSSLQVPDEGSAKAIADALNAEYRGIPCPGEVLEWEPAAEARINELAAKLQARPNLKCQLQLVDRATYAHNQIYANRMPAAYARCDTRGGNVLWIAAFSPTSASRDAFVTGEEKYLCGSQGGVVAVEGADWALLVADPHVADIAAAALGGRASAPAC
jgi:hypothetical protein